MKTAAKARTILGLLAVSLVAAAWAPVGASEPPGTVCVVSRGVSTPAAAAAPTAVAPEPERLQTRIAVAVEERTVRRAVAQVARTLPTSAAVLDVTLADRMDELRRLGALGRLNELGRPGALRWLDELGRLGDVERRHGLESTGWLHARSPACRGDHFLAGGLDALTSLAKAPARGVSLAVDAVVVVVKLVPTILHTLL